MPASSCVLSTTMIASRSVGVEGFVLSQDGIG